MDVRFASHNLQQESTKRFLLDDPHLKRLKSQPLVHHSTLVEELPIHIPGIYMLGGGRQVGKTTVLKQWMAHLLETGVTGQAIGFFTGELIDDHHALTSLIQEFIQDNQSHGRSYLIIDEVTYIKDWNKAVKYAADSGWLESTILILTGSDLVILQEGLILLPGRRGRAEKHDFHLYPLSFRETVLLKHGSAVRSKDTLLLDQEFQNYLVHGGFLTAINDMARFGKIEIATLRIYSDWIRGDILKRGKNEGFLKEILAAILKHSGSQITWNVLCQSLSIDHPKTVVDYAELLCRMDCLYIQSALLEDKLTAAPKKAKKLVLVDPFIQHAVAAYLMSQGASYSFEQHLLPQTTHPESASKLVEAIVVSHYRRITPTYYIKAEGEVDLAVLETVNSKKGFRPIEVKWSNQIRSKDLKQIRKYKNALVLSKTSQTEIEGVQCEHLPSHLFDLLPSSCGRVGEPSVEGVF